MEIVWRGFWRFPCSNSTFGFPRGFLLKKFKIINKCNQTQLFPWFTSQSQRWFPQISIMATVEAFTLTKIERWEHRIEKPMASEWKERSSTKTNSHGLLTFIRCLSNGTSLLAMTCPCKTQAGWPFWRPYRIVDFSAYNRAQDNQFHWLATGQN